jgi:hypothetical protein
MFGLSKFSRNTGTAIKRKPKSKRESNLADLEFKKANSSMNIDKRLKGLFPNVKQTTSVPTNFHIDEEKLFNQLFQGYVPIQHEISTENANMDLTDLKLEYFESLQEQMTKTMVDEPFMEIEDDLLDLDKDY